MDRQGWRTNSGGASLGALHMPSPVMTSTRFEGESAGMLGGSSFGGLAGMKPRRSLSLLAGSSTFDHEAAISNFLRGAAQRTAARRTSLDNARLASLGLSVTRRPDASHSNESKIVYDAIMVMERAKMNEPPPPPPPPPAQHQAPNHASSPLMPSSAPKSKLRIPSPTAPLPSMENMQLREIVEPHDHDVLCGRGGSVNHHHGNEQFRQLVQSLKVKYLFSSKSEKFQLSEDIVRAVRSQNPPGRFLQRDENNKKWFDIGDRAREKSAQALREGAPDIRESLKPRAAEQQQAAARSSSLSSSFSNSPYRRSSLPSSALDSGSNGMARRRTSLVASSNKSSRDAIMSCNTTGHVQNAKQLAADIMTAHVQQQAREAQVIAEAQEAARAASIPLGTMNSVPRLAANSGGMTVPGISLDQPHSWDARRSSMGYRDAGGLSPSSSLLASQSLGRSNSLPRLDPDKVMLAKAMVRRSITGGGRSVEDESRFSTASTKRSSSVTTSSLTEDLVNRLVFAETLAQRTVQGTVTEEMKAEEKRMGLYVDVGLLGMELGEIEAKRAMGQTEQDIVDEAYNRLKLKRDKENDGNENASEPALKKPKRNVAEAAAEGMPQKDMADEKTLVAIGAMIKLRKHGTDEDTEPEESEQSSSQG